MANTKISALPTFTGDTSGVYLVMNNSGNTESYNVTKETLLSGYTENGLTKFTSSWTVTPGTNSYSFTVDQNSSYIMWVRGNIDNGIIIWNATVSISNINVPVIGVQYAWNYTGGTSPILFTSIPSQIIGTPGAIDTTNVPAASANTFTFGISNTTGTNQIIEYGYVKIS
jgi:hypothetical protein